MEKFDIDSFESGTYKKTYEKEEAYLRAKKKLEKLVGFYWHLAIYVIINLFLIILIGVNSDEGFFQWGTFATPIFWGIGLMFHFLGVFGPDFIFGKNWEEKKMKEFIDKEKEDFQRFQ